MALWEYLWAWSDVTKWLYHLNWNANDDSWNGKNWTASNVSRVGWKVGGGAASFNGSSSYINLWDTSTVFWTISTLSIWFSYNNITDNLKYIISNRDSASWWEFLLKQEDDTVVFEWIDLSTNNWLSTTVGTNIVANVMYNVIITRTWLSTASIYFNWKRTDITNWRKNNWWYSNQPLLLWALTTALYFFNWQIDEVIIENRVWTATEVQKYYTYASWKFGIQ